MCSDGFVYPRNSHKYNTKRYYVNATDFSELSYEPESNWCSLFGAHHTVTTSPDERPGPTVPSTTLETKKGSSVNEYRSHWHIRTSLSELAEATSPLS